MRNLGKDSRSLEVNGISFDGCRGCKGPRGAGQENQRRWPGNWLHFALGLLFLSPVALMFQTLPEKEQRLKVVGAQ
jgi:hypothetical protein